MNLIDRPFIQLSPTDIPRVCLPVTVTNPRTNQSTKVFGLIDTGADECAFPAGYAQVLGHNLQLGFPKQVFTGNGVTTAYSHTVCMNIEGFEIKDILIDFMPNLHTPLLGVRSFLSNFILTIDYPNQKFSLLQKT